MRILLIKMSSLGDIIHTLPALTDAARAYPDLKVDWLVEEAFQEIPKWHAKVDRVIPIALRRWRKKKGKALWEGEWLQLIKALRQEHYDYIIDAQGLLKSSIFTRLARGTHKIGLSWSSAREGIASLLYQRRIQVPWGPHAVTRSRALFANALSYSLPTDKGNFGITRPPSSPLIASRPYYVFLHGTTWDTKHWPESYWIELAQKVEDADIQLLWGNEAELKRAERIASAVPHARVLPHKLSLSEVAGLLASAKGIVSVDTGLGHLGAALSIPTVSLFGPTDLAQSGTWGENQLHLGSTFSCAPCFSKTCTYKGAKTIDPPCFESLSPQRVWESLKKVVKGTSQ